MPPVDPDRRAFAAELYAAGREHDARHADRLARWRNVEPETAGMLAVLARATKARRILEIGTSNGYSTIWLADAAEAVGARLVSAEIDGARTEQARGNLERAGLTADLRTQDAGELLRDTGDGEWGFVFLDAERPAYAGYWPDVLRVLAPGALLVIDNVISHAEQVEEVTALIEAEPGVTSAVVPIGAGLRVVVKDRAA
jgi:predicted O-methyltransferase YrrM